MVRLREIMTSDMVIMSPETTVREAMEILATRHVSGAPVISGGQLVGVVSASDLMAFTAALPGVPTQRDASEEWVESGEPIVEEVDAASEDDVPGAFFSDLWEDAGADVSSRFANIATPEWNALEQFEVTDVMTRAPLTTLTPDATAEDAAELMRSQRIHRVLVTDAGKLVGIVTSLDIARAVADHRFTVRRYIFNHDRSFADDIVG